MNCRFAAPWVLHRSFIPERPQRELRELVRYRRSLIQQRAQAVNCMPKVLEGANIKLSSVAMDIAGVSDRARLEALATGNGHPETLAGLAKGPLGQKRSALLEAVEGLIGSHQRMPLQSQLLHLRFWTRNLPMHQSRRGGDATTLIQARKNRYCLSLGDFGVEQGRSPVFRELLSSL